MKSCLFLTGITHADTLACVAFTASVQPDGWQGLGLIGLPHSVSVLYKSW